MDARLVAPRLAIVWAVGLASCYAPANWDECRVQCSASGDCPSGATCGGDGYCHRRAGACGSANGNNSDGGGTGGNGDVADTKPPSFAGAVSAAGGVNSIVLGWNPASDDQTPPSQTVYLVYQASQPGAEDFATPTAITPAGTTSFAIPGLSPSTPYFFVVRARDEAGNVERNEVEVSATTLAGSDAVPPTFAGLATARALVANAIDLSWAPATDNVTASDGIVYLVYRGATAGGEDFHAPVAMSPAGATSAQVGGLTPGTVYYFVVRARDQAGNIDANSVERSATPFADTTPPAFAGAKSAAATGLTSIKVSWNAGSDDVTPAGKIVYDVYQALVGGHEDFAHPSATSAPGATSIAIGGLLPATSYYFVVRARDQAGNSDGNTVEVSATTPLL